VNKWEDGAVSARTISTRLSAQRPDWFFDALESIRRDGFAIVEDVLSPALLDRTREAMYGVHERVLAELGRQRLERAGELGVMRLMLRYDGHFYSLLELDEVLDVVDTCLSSAAILHLQSGLIVPSCGGNGAAAQGPTRFERTFPRYLDGYVASVNTFLAIDEFTSPDGAMLLVPGSHQRPQPPDRMEIDAAVAALCPAGSMLVFDSTLWHAAAVNRSGRDRLAINQQFTRPFITPQIDYVRALGDEMVLRREPRTQQLLGWYTRVATSLEEYYA
jgi:ectoine hydroxylase-related dioxygenase (phytanoyl-CoA dioxygenase family)